MFTVAFLHRIRQDRVAVGNEMFTMLPGQKVFVLCKGGCGQEKVGPGQEALALQAYPGTAACTDSQQLDLAGNAFTGNVILSLLLGLYANLPQLSWKDEEPGDSRRPGNDSPSQVADVCNNLFNSDSGSG